MAIATYEPLATITLGGPDAEVIFGSIPQRFRDLVLVIDGAGSSSGYPRFQVNGDTANNYSYVGMIGYSGGTFSGATTAAFIQFNYSEANQKASSVISFMDYSTDKHKTFLSRSLGFDAGLSTTANAGRWASTSAVTSIRVFRDAGNWNSGTTLNLFGVIA